MDWKTGSQEDARKVELGRVGQRRGGEGRGGERMVKVKVKEKGKGKFHSHLIYTYIFADSVTL